MKPWNWQGEWYPPEAYNQRPQHPMDAISEYNQFVVDQSRDAHFLSAFKLIPAVDIFDMSDAD